MKYTRLSLFYLVGYLTMGGLGFLLFPQPSLKLFQATGDYNGLMVRMVGGFMLALAIFAAQLIRLRVEVLYGTTLIVRTMLLAFLVPLYFMYDEPMLIVLFIIVGLGYTLTLSAFLTERKSKGT